MNVCEDVVKKVKNGPMVIGLLPLIFTDWILTMKTLEVNPSKNMPRQYTVSLLVYTLGSTHLCV